MRDRLLARPVPLSDDSRRAHPGGSSEDIVDTEPHEDPFWPPLLAGSHQNAQQRGPNWQWTAALDTGAVSVACQNAVGQLADLTRTVAERFKSATAPEQGAGRPRPATASIAQRHSSPATSSRDRAIFKDEDDDPRQPYSNERSPDRNLIYLALSAPAPRAPRPDTAQTSRHVQRSSGSRPEQRARATSAAPSHDRSRIEAWRSRAQSASTRRLPQRTPLPLGRPVLGADRGVLARGSASKLPREPLAASAETKGTSRLAS
jgi:hypothetical protein